MPLFPESLAHEIADRRVVFFVGSGLSKAAHATLPTWSELLRKLAEKLPKKSERILISKLIRKERLLDAAQIINDSLPRADLNATLRSIFQIRPAPINDIYNNILQMDPKTIVTTNYDEFLEKNFEHFSRGSEAHSITKHKHGNLISDLRSPIRSIVKLHGCITEPNDVVLDRLSYFTAKRDNPGLFHAVSALMTVNTVLFIGYSISDPDIQLILENVHISSKSSHPHYALVSKIEHPSIKKAMTDTYNINFIEYPVGKYDRVPLAITELKEAVKDVRSRRGIV